MATFIATQPVLDKNSKTFGYEVLFRNNFESNQAVVEDGDSATRNVIHTVFNEIGVEELTDGLPVFINFTENVLLEEQISKYPCTHLVIELLETVTPTKELISKCRKVKAMGYKIVLDDFVYQEGYEELIELADIIKIDFLNTPREQIRHLVSQFNGIKTLLAEKVETYEEYIYAKNIGFSLFQGYYFALPKTYNNSEVKPLEVTYLKLFNLVNQNEIDYDQVTDVIRKDFYLSTSILKLVNSIVYSLPSQITSLKQAAMYVGHDGLKKWVTLLIFRGFNQFCTNELIRLSLVRAKFIENLGIADVKYKNIISKLYLTGLLSLVDVILDQPIKKILEDFHVDTEIYEAVVYGNGLLGKFLDLAKAYESGKLQNIQAMITELKLNSNDIVTAYISATKWYHEISENI